MDAQVQTRSCDRKRGQVGKLTSKGCRQICIPMTREQYDVTWNAPASVREYLEPLIRDYPEMFPASVSTGYQLHGHLPESKKLPGVRLRQIRTSDGVYTLRPSFAFSYMTGTVDELEKPLFLLALHVPIWAVTFVFGRNDMYWQRLLERMGRNSLAGTTVRVSEKMPQHIAADEDHLLEAYGVFDKEARDVSPDWQPLTVNTDGWKATRNAFTKLFPKIVLLLCFLHGFLKIRDRCRKYHDLHQRVWDVYRAESAADFGTRMDSLKTWSETADLRGPVQENLEKLFVHKDDYAASYAHPNCYRTSNQVDRPMNRICRSLYASRGIHGHQVTSERRLRGLCLLENFRPFAPRSNIDRPHQSPAHRLNDRSYHPNWLHNLQSSASLQGFHRTT